MWFLNFGHSWQAAAAMSAYTDWAPKEFDESAVNPASTAAAADSGQAQQALPDTPPAADQSASGFVYDSTSGGLTSPTTPLAVNASVAVLYSKPSLRKSKDWSVVVQGTIMTAARGTITMRTQASTLSARASSGLGWTPPLASSMTRHSSLPIQPLMPHRMPQVTALVFTL